MADLERNEKKEEERVGAEDDVEAEGVWAFRDGRDIADDPFLSSSSSPKLSGVVTAGGCPIDACPVSQSPDRHGCKVTLEIARPSRATGPVLISCFIIFANLC